MTPDSRLAHELFMHRCLELAPSGAVYVAPNPMVGAVLVHERRIIGEGCHQKYGEAHAEVNCIASVKEKDKQFISQATLYISLEPCRHFGKTPPCTDLIIRNRIPKVVIGCLDPYKEVSGGGMEKLKAAGVEVEYGILEKECKELNRRFFTFVTQHRPYIILKWAQTADGFMAPPPPEGGTNENSLKQRLFISNEYSNRLVHRWRSEEAAILVGTNTALLDDPELTTRLWEGPLPVRLVVDMDLKLPSSLKIFNDASPTIIFNTKVHSKESEWSAPSLPIAIGMERGRVRYYQVTHDVSLVHQMVNALYQMKLLSVLVEGGARLLQSFIDEGMWDEARIIKNEELIINNGLNAPLLMDAEKVSAKKVSSDLIEIYKPKDTLLPAKDS